jgi:hypothetical protein
MSDSLLITDIQKLIPANLAEPNLLGGGERDRTDDLLLAKQALSQLSYTPKGGGPNWSRTNDLTLIRGAL